MFDTFEHSFVNIWLYSMFVILMYFSFC